MATVTPAVPTVASASAALDTIASKVVAFAAEVSAEKAKIVGVLEAHAAAHNAQADAHLQEVAAAQLLIAKADPTAPTAQQQAAAFILTSGSTPLANVINFCGRNWRYAILVAGVALLAVGKYVWHVI